MRLVLAADWPGRRGAAGPPTVGSANEHGRAVRSPAGGVACREIRQVSQAARTGWCLAQVSPEYISDET